MADTQVEKLLPCPFCGSEPEFDDWNTSYRPDSQPLWGVVCKSRKCVGEIGFFNADKAIAIEEWNTRPTMTAQSPNAGLVEHSDVTAWRVAEAMYRGEAAREYDERTACLESLWIDEPDTATWFARAQDAIAALAPPQADHALVEALVDTLVNLRAWFTGYIGNGGKGADEELALIRSTLRKADAALAAHPSLREGGK